MFLAHARLAATSRGRTCVRASVCERKGADQSLAVSRRDSRRRHLVREWRPVYGRKLSSDLRHDGEQEEDVQHGKRRWRCRWRQRQRRRLQRLLLRDREEARPAAGHAVQPRQVLRAGIRRRLVRRDVRQRHEPEPRRQVSPASPFDSAWVRRDGESSPLIPSLFLIT